MIQLLAGILLLSVLVIVHELGHFLFAKAMGVRVLAFSVGFGPRLFGFKIGETEYMFCAIPLGGYVRMYGEILSDQVTEEEKKFGFMHQPYWKKTLIAVAGPLFNFILPVILFFIVFLGSETVLHPVVGTVVPGQVAEKAGLLPGDRIVSVDGKKMATFNDVVEQVSQSPEKPLQFEIERASKKMNVRIVPSAEQNPSPIYRDKKVGRIGVMPAFERPQVAVVDPNSPAGRAGLKTLDKVVAVNGKSVSSAYLLFRELDEHPGESVAITVEREANKLNLTLPPAQAAAAKEPTTKRFAVTIDELASPEFKERLAKTKQLLAESQLELEKDRGLAFIGNVVSEVEPESVAAELGLKAGDRIVAFDGESVSSVVELATLLATATGEFHVIGVQQQGAKPIVGVFRPTAEHSQEPGLKAEAQFFGMKFYEAFEQGPTFTRYVGPVEATSRAFARTGDLIAMTVRSLWMLVKFEVPVSQLGGPIMIFGVAGQAAQQGLAFYIYVMALISVNLGLLNLLPVPVLDGGHLLLFSIEAIQRKPLSEKTRALATKIGLAFILTLMAIAIFNDVSRLMVGG